MVEERKMCKVTRDLRHSGDHPEAGASVRAPEGSFKSRLDSAFVRFSDPKIEEFPVGTVVEVKVRFAHLRST